MNLAEAVSRAVTAFRGLGPYSITGLNLNDIVLDRLTIGGR